VKHPPGKQHRRSPIITNSKDRPERQDIIKNERIRVPSVRLVDQDGAAAVIPTFEALRRARERGLDLVLVADGDVPVCRLIDADRWRFEKAKAEREQAKRQRDLSVETKEIQLRPVTDANDIAVKSRRARVFLESGDKVKIVVRFRGRERTHRDEGRRAVERFLAALGEHRVDRPLLDGERDMMMILSPMVSKADLVRSREKAA
jgi:translation initiation factor IF-3